MDGQQGKPHEGTGRAGEKQRVMRRSFAQGLLALAGTGSLIWGLLSYEGGYLGRPISYDDTPKAMITGGGMALVAAGFLRRRTD